MDVVFKLIAGLLTTFALFWAGLGAGLWYDRRAPHTPEWTVHVWIFSHTFGLPESLKAQLADYRAAGAAAKARADAVAKAQTIVSQAAGVHDAGAQAAIRRVFVTITQEIPGALPPAVDRAFPLSNGWVRLYDASIGGVPPAAPASGEPDDAASAIAPSQALTLTVGNNGECLADRQRLLDLQAWEAAERQAAGAKP